jgi:hypothetical protein
MYRPGETAIADLRVDLKNPRVPEEEFPSEIAAISYLIDHADVNELVQSIGRSGWLDFEPLIVLDAENNTVIEGNRRLAALRLLKDRGLRQELRFRLPEGITEEVQLPDRVRVFNVDSRAEARDFIGFKHINGAFKWDSFAKAKYAEEWLSDDPRASVKDVSERLGDSHNTVLRLVNGYRVLRQAERLGFSTQDITAPRGFSFSHLYTALPSPAVREFLGIPGETSDLLPQNPVPEDHRDNLVQYLTWLYGQKGRGNNVILSQNPDLGKLTKVLSNRSATRMLQTTNKLPEAFDMVEDKGKAFEAAIFNLLNAARTAAAQVGKYDGDPELLQVIQTTNQTVRGIIAGMKAIVDDRQADKDQVDS